MNTFIDMNFDQEWIALIIEAKELGMTADEIRLFLQSGERREQSGNRDSTIATTDI